MKVLLIAPRTNLVYGDEEVQAIMRSGLEVTPLLGNVTHNDVLREVEKAYDVLWLCTHGSNDGVLLSDGLLQTSLLVALVREKFKLIFLNTCKSYEVAQMIQNETSAEVIATIIEVPDREAFQTGAIFARELAQVANVEKAYYRSRPGNNRTYIRLAGRTVMYDQNSKGVEHVVSELQMAVFGNPKVNFSGMMNELREIRKIVDDMAQKMDELQDTGKERSDLITEIKQEVTELKHKVNQLDGTVRWRLHPAAIALLSIFGSAFLIGEVIRLVSLFF